MGNVIEKVSSTFLRKVKKVFSTGTPRSLALLGLDSSGKTTLLYFLKTGVVQKTVSTVGFNCEPVDVEDVKFQIFDVGGQKAFQKFWLKYTKGSSGIVYMVDLQCETRFKEAGEALWDVLKGHTEPKPLLVFANKADTLDDAKIEENLSDLSVKLGLKDYQAPFSIVVCSVVKAGSEGDNGRNSKIIFDAFTWLNKELKKMPKEVL